jgi:5-methylcytosine-specific restriction endonuclease McrA
MFDPTPYRRQKRVGASKMSNANKAAREHLQHWLLEVFQRCASRCETAQARIDLLRTYSNIVILWQSTFGLQMERAAWNSGYKQELCELDPKGTRQIVHACWACQHFRAEVRHHVIELQHGGFSNDAANLVPLCNECHGRIHHWLMFDFEKYRIKHLLVHVGVITYKGEMCAIMDDLLLNAISAEEAKGAMLALLDEFNGSFCRPCVQTMISTGTNEAEKLAQATAEFNALSEATQ